MSLDDGVTSEEIRKTVMALKHIRGRRGSLDNLVDAIEPRRLAHVAEEALRAVAGGRGLWRHTGQDTDLISLAIKWLNFSHFRNGLFAGTHFWMPDGVQAVPTHSDALAEPDRGVEP